MMQLVCLLGMYSYIKTQGNIRGYVNNISSLNIIIKETIGINEEMHQAVLIKIIASVATDGSDAVLNMLAWPLVTSL